jgi:hypothetical protein
MLWKLVAILIGIALCQLWQTGCQTLVDLMSRV